MELALKNASEEFYRHNGTGEARRILRHLKNGVIMSNYNMAEMRKEYITLCAMTLNKASKFYAEDYENICRAANRYTRRELIEALNRQKAIASVRASEISANCII